MPTTKVWSRELMTMMPSRQNALPLHPLRVSSRWLGEPDLYFAGDRPHPDPKVGIPLYGPRSLDTSRHKQEVHVGFIGTGEGVARAQQFLDSCSAGVDG